MSNISEQPVNTELGLTFDETALIRQIQAGRTAIFADLIGRFQDRLYNLAFRLTSSPEDASDLTQETFTRAIKGIHQFKGNSRFYTWLVRIMINISNDWKTKSRSDRNLQQEMQAILQRSQASDIIGLQDPQSQAQSHEMVELIWRAIDLLEGTVRRSKSSCSATWSSSATTRLLTF